MIKSTIQLYIDTATDTLKAIGRGPAVWLFSIALPFIVGGFAILLSPLGIIGRFAAGFVMITMAGAYLFLVGQSLERTNPLGFSIIKDSIGNHLWDVMGIFFLHWILSLGFAYGSLPDMVFILVTIVIFILFNPWPEVIYQDRRTGSMDILVRSFRFMQANGPEWVVPHLLLVALGFGSLIPGPTGVLQMGMGVASLLLFHPVMVFRGALFRNLNKGSRRSRAWQSRF
ncbi:MAG: hypothetical protein CL930_02335 [Deltaproteobacteria bacterium]|nr:hypothetical protein [Deltaproteobacteria bacterium]